METKKGSAKQTRKNRTSQNTKNVRNTNAKKVASKKGKIRIDYKLPLMLLLLVIVLLVVLSFVNNGNKWVQDGNFISRGNEKYEIGDYYDYDESNNGTISGLKDVKWKVLGVDDNGHLLIMSASSIGSLTLGDENNLETSQRDYVEGPQKVNDLTKNYGNGKGAISVRSFTNSDLVKLSNYADEGEQNEYTYYWSNEENPKSVDQEGIEYITKIAYNGNFIWYDQNTNTWNNTKKIGTETGSNPTKIVTAKNTLSAFNTDIKEEYIIDTDSKKYKMVYLNDNGEREMFWSDVSYVNATRNYVAYGQNVILTNALNYRVFVYSAGVTRQETAGVRAVVTID